jgi:excisionase family DNA binding protein
MDHERMERDVEYLMPREVAEELGGVTPKTVARWAKEGRLPYLETLGGHRRYPAGAIRELAATRSYQPMAEDAAEPDGTADSAPTEGLLPGAGDAPLFPPFA